MKTMNNDDNYNNKYMKNETMDPSSSDLDSHSNRMNNTSLSVVDETTTTTTETFAAAAAAAAGTTPLNTDYNHFVETKKGGNSNNSTITTTNNNGGSYGRNVNSSSSTSHGGDGGGSGTGSGTGTSSHFNKNDDESNNSRSNGNSSYGIRMTKQLKRFRFVFVTFLIIFGISVAIVIFQLVRKNEINEFQDSFEDSSSRLLEQVHSTIERKIGALESFSFSITSYVNFHNNNNNNNNNATSTWPFVTIPDFAYQAASIRELSQAISIELCPIVTESNREQWQIYSQQHRTNWIQDGLQFEELVKQDYFLTTLLSSSNKDSNQRRLLRTKTDNHQYNHDYNTDHNDDNAAASPTPANRKLASTTTTTSSSTTTTLSTYDEISYIDFDGNRVPIPTYNDENNNNNNNDNNNIDSIYYIPIWQSSPVSQELTNLDLHFSNFFASDIDLSLQTNQVIIGRTVNVPTTSTTTSTSTSTEQEIVSKAQAEETILIKTFQDSLGDRNIQDSFYHNDNNNNNNNNDNIQNENGDDGPLGFLYVPIFDTLGDVYRRQPVALLTAVMHWESYMLQALPPNTPEIRVVLSSNCDSAYTYAVGAENVHFVGDGDLHSNDFESFKVNDDDTFRFDSLRTSIQRYHGIPINDSCQYRMEVYPTQDYHDKYITSRPWIFFAMTIGIFLFLILIIHVYDRRVETNYEIVYRRAKQAGAIVSSIFPAAVRRRLYQDVEDSKMSNNETFQQNSSNFAVGGQQQQPPQHSDESPGMINPSAMNNTNSIINNSMTTKMKIKRFLANPSLNNNSTCENPTFDTANGGGDGGVGSERGILGHTTTATNKVDVLGGRGSEIPMDVIPQNGKAIADLFPDVTIMFSDVVGFAAWSSQRDPSEVFTFLQNLYHEFDSIARNMGVFKVETIGDCYVAATGIPEPQSDHAIRMVKFASKCQQAMMDVTRDLEIRLGPDTGELKIRSGLHSGPVTAGVLKGAKARFQLFGDTMNMASRMQNISLPGRIQCSQATADCIREAGKAHWLHARETLVAVKGKGRVQTYWLDPTTSSSSSSSKKKVPKTLHSSGLTSGKIATGGGRDFLEESERYSIVMDETSVLVDDTEKSLNDFGTSDNRFHRLIDWNVELLTDLLKQIAARRINISTSKSKKQQNECAPKMRLRGGSTALDEVSEIVSLPQIDQTEKATKSKKIVRASDIELSVAVLTQLRDYVTTIASMYRPNAFHNFEHASHVTMSTIKLLRRVAGTGGNHYNLYDDNDYDEDKNKTGAAEGPLNNPKQLHDYTVGITSDPLTQFTLVFCALIHDVDHAGVSNYQLIKEKATIARIYKNKSIAEQNSVDLSWDLLMDENYKDLQQAIYADEDELKRFRQLLVNIVLATDIFDSDMKALRERRWDKAFQYATEDEDAKEEEKTEDLPKKALERNYDKPLSRVEGANLKATIVMEHLIQASDVAHTMQHWDIYLKWNERLFCEMYAAYKNGRAMKDPSRTWYEGEIMFFDKYVIPLAKKLADCQVFGVSSDECLNYANQNRKQWAIRGDEIIQEFLERYEARQKSAALLASTGSSSYREHHPHHHHAPVKLQL